MGGEQFGLSISVATITEEVIELSNILNLYLDMLPRQARWQVEYAVTNYFQDSTFLYSLFTILPSIERITTVAEVE